MSDLPEPIEVTEESQERTEPAFELTVRDRRTGKLRRVRGVHWDAALDARTPTRRMELWVRDERRGGLTKVLSLQDRREREREPDLALLTAYWMGF